MNEESSKQSTEGETLDSSAKKTPSERWQKSMPFVIIALQVILIGVLTFTLVSVNRIGSLQEQNVLRFDEEIGQIDEKIVTLIGANTDLGNQFTGLQDDVSGVALLLNNQSQSTEENTSKGQPLNAALNLTFACIDAQSKAEITPCTIQVQILDQQSVDAFETPSGQALFIPAKFRFSITVGAEGYQPKSEIFEYIEKGVAELHTLELDKK